MDFTKMIKQIERQVRELQKELAEKANIELYQISQLCSGKKTNIMLDTAKRICKVLKCNWDTLHKTFLKLNIPARTPGEAKMSVYEQSILKQFTDYTIMENTECSLNLQHTTCGHIFPFQKQRLLRYKPEHGIFDICPKCFNYSSKSFPEQELLDFVREIYSGRIIENDRTIINPKELDIVLPDIKIAIEFCGLFWHTEEMGRDRKYHFNKYKAARKQGYTLITIFSDEWKHKKELVKSKLLHLLQATPAVKKKSTQWRELHF